MRRNLMIVFAFGAAVSTPGIAAPAKKASILAQLAADHLHRPLRDVAVLVTAVPAATENVQGGAALVRVADGADGGNPTCHLLQLEGRPGAPGKVVSALQLSVCPRYDKDQKGAQLARVELSRKWSAWRVRVASQRMDTMAKGVETSVLWVLAADLADGAGVKAVFERTSTTFRSQEDIKQNQAESCEAPVLLVGDEPDGLAITCDTETMLGSLPKRQKSTFAYAWQGERYAPK
jgi:hypothetical protein